MSIYTNALRKAANEKADNTRREAENNRTRPTDPKNPTNRPEGHLSLADRNKARRGYDWKRQQAEDEQTFAHQPELGAIGIGALGGGTIGAMLEAKTRRERLRNVLLGVLVGAPATLGAQQLYDRLG